MYVDKQYSVNTIQWGQERGEQSNSGSDQAIEPSVKAPLHALSEIKHQISIINAQCSTIPNRDLCKLPLRMTLTRPHQWGSCRLEAVPHSRGLFPTDAPGTPGSPEPVGQLQTNAKTHKSETGIIITSTNTNFHKLKPGFLCIVLTWVSCLAVDALFRGAAYGPVLIHKETMTQRVTQPLHGRRDTAAWWETSLPSAAQEHSLQRHRDRNIISAQKLNKDYQNKSKRIKLYWMKRETLTPFQNLVSALRRQHFKRHMNTAVAKYGSIASILAIKSNPRMHYN